MGSTYDSVKNDKALKLLGSWSSVKGNNGKSYGRYAVECFCGKIFYPRGVNVRAGLVKSCGCTRGVKHGGYLSPEYQSWKGMKSRCYYSGNIRYDRYGGRGITVCEQWKNSFANFREDMGSRPKGTTLDRIDTNGNYEPSNCRWATYLTQTYNQDRNKRVKYWVVYQDIRMSLWELSQALGIKISTCYWQYKIGGLKDIVDYV